jgi:hypothetical protein
VNRPGFNEQDATPGFFSIANDQPGNTDAAEFRTLGDTGFEPPRPCSAQVVYTI